MIDTAVQNLIQYAIQKKLIAPEDEPVSYTHLTLPTNSRG